MMDDQGNQQWANRANDIPFWAIPLVRVFECSFKASTVPLEWHQQVDCPH